MASEEFDTEVSQRFECDECAGDVVLVDSLSTDVSGTEAYECVDCGAEGTAYWSATADAVTNGSVNYR